MRFLISSLTCYSWPCYSLIAAIVIYGVWGAPTPDQLGWVEAITALFLIGAVDWKGIFLERKALLLFLLLLFLPLMTGLVLGNQLRDIARDVVALGFICLPLFFGQTIKQMGVCFHYIVMLLGSLFAVRAIYPYAAILSTPDLWGHGAPADLLYLANSPEVLFTALMAITLLFEAFQKRCNWKMVVLLVMAAGTCLVAMALMMQRAGLVAVLIVIIMCSFKFVGVKPVRAIMAFLAMGLILVPFYPALSSIWQDLWQKQQMVGVNGRWAEWQAVAAQLDYYGLGWVFGCGWGGRFHDPAVGGLSVTYTHALLSYLLLKSGVVGLTTVLAGIILWIAAAFRRLNCGLLQKMIIVGPMIWPLLIAVGLYASYKSLGFGLILCAFHDSPIRKLEKNETSVS